VDNGTASMLVRITLVRRAERYPPGMQIEGVVDNLANYGAFIEIEKGIDGLLHVGDMSWVRIS